jgi:hypothetical protein
MTRPTKGVTTTMKRVIAVSLALVMVISALALAAGVGAFDTFKSGIGARALAMGSAFIAVADDSTAVSWNPAGLAQLNDTRIGGMSTDLYGLGLTHQYIGAVTTFSNLGIGLAWERGSYLIDKVYDANGVAGTARTWDQSAIVGSLATNIMDIGLAGANVKYYMESNGAGKSASGFGFDLGVLVNLGDMFTIGVVATDLGGTSVSWTGGAADSVSGLYKAGVAMKLADGMLVLASDLEFNGTKMGNAHVGIEFKVIKELALRAGAVLTDNFGGYYFTVGGGINVAGLYVDVAYLINDKIDNTLVLSAEFSLGDLLGGAPATTPVPETPAPTGLE